MVWNGDKQTSTQGSSLKHFLEMTILDRSKVITTATITKAVVCLISSEKIANFLVVFFTAVSCGSAFCSVDDIT